MKQKARKYLKELKIQRDDCGNLVNNVLNQRIDILIQINSFAKCSFSEISKELPLTKKGQLIEEASKEANKLVESHPELKDLLEQNKNLKKELVSIKPVYNSLVSRWNREIFLWPTKKIVAAKEGYTTELTYTVLDELKVNAKSGLLE